MKYIAALRCLGCGREYPADRLMNLCPRDQRPVELVFDLERLRSALGRSQWYDPGRRDMWRFGPLLPLNPLDSADREHIVSDGEGATPLTPAPVAPELKSARLDIRIKNEGRPRAGFGHNPTLSFKDRGMVMAASMARRFGVDRVVVPTQGNAGDSLAHYARRAGLRVTVIMPEDTPLPVLGSVAAAARRDEGVRLELVQGTIREAGALMKRDWLPRGWFNMATFQEPGWRIEGKKTLGLELAEPAVNDGAWRVPDVIVYPTGGGTGLLGMWKAFDELQHLGLIDGRRPRMIAVQSEATAPVVRAFDAGDVDVSPVTPGHTRAVGLNVPGGVGHFRVLEILRRSAGGAVAVDEEAIRRWTCHLFKVCDEWICPEAAACFAALEPSLDQKLIRPGDRVVIVNTASLEKYLPEFRQWL